MAASSARLKSWKCSPVIFITRLHRPDIHGHCLPKTHCAPCIKLSKSAPPARNVSAKLRAASCCGVFGIKEIQGGGNSPTSPVMHELICVLAQARSCDELRIINIPRGNPVEVFSQLRDVTPTWSFRRESHNKLSGGARQPLDHCEVGAINGVCCEIRIFKFAPSAFLKAKQC